MGNVRTQFTTEPLKRANTTLKFQLTLSRSIWKRPEKPYLLKMVVAGKWNIIGLRSITCGIQSLYAMLLGPVHKLDEP